MKHHISKKKIKNIFSNIILEENHSLNTFFYTSLKDLKKNSNKKYNLIIFKENKIFNLIKVFFFFFIWRIKFHKNFFLLFRIRKNQFIGHNFLPDWPGLYSNKSFYKNLLIWLKNFIYFFILNRRLAIIALKKV